MAMRLLTKEQMSAKLQDLMARGWLENENPGNDGGIGNTIDSLLGLTENNLPIADTAQWEMKTHRLESASMVSLFHKDPQPRAVIPRHLLPKYGWPDEKREGERSFRQTLTVARFTDRGFRIEVDRVAGRLLLRFDASQVGANQSGWLDSVRARTSLGELDPQPFWDLQALALHVSTKMLNAFFVGVESKESRRPRRFRIRQFTTLQGFNTEGFFSALQDGNIRVDFDARTGHNHGTKFRIYDNDLIKLYTYVDTVSAPD